MDVHLGEAEEHEDEDDQQRRAADQGDVERARPAQHRDGPDAGGGEQGAEHERQHAREQEELDGQQERLEHQVELREDCVHSGATSVGQGEGTGALGPSAPAVVLATQEQASISGASGVSTPDLPSVASKALS